MSKKFKKMQTVALISFTMILVVIFVVLEGNITIKNLTESVSGKPIASVLLLLLLFAVKSLSIIIPLPSLYLASGMLFPPLTAVFASYLGLAVTLSIPYFLGLWSGGEGIEYIKSKYPKIEKIIKIQKKNEFFASFIVRIIGWFPCDIISFYFGACKTPYYIYITSSLIGSSIGVITNTLLGDVILNPLSWKFAILTLIKIVVSISAFGVAYFLNKEDKI
ncbi:VTT domain-containing protein [Peptoniphilus catoniae]|uniref:VTT domain-containing protein n=1 Tax=Peptoniphilus catoniae TaxID=1660341 RepID=UPI0010FF0798|nr:VTT domain-containing protein [Peptoniphilus catoniae]